jgi:hypothetical protein
MSLTEETVCLEELAATLGRRPEWLMRRWLKLHMEHGFPRKHPTGWTWPRAAVAAWLRAGGVMEAPASPANDNGSVDFEAAYRAALSDRYGGTS